MATWTPETLYPADWVRQGAQVEAWSSWLLLVGLWADNGGWDDGAVWVDQLTSWTEA